MSEPYSPPPEAPAEQAIRESQIEHLELDLLLEAIHRQYGFDFRSYARSSLLRRVRKRQLEEAVPSLSALQARVLRDPTCMERLLRDLSINVTAMFRDPSFFLTFRRVAIPLLRTYPYLRLWHAGCSTGEEVYATAIMLREEGLLERARIYATDINQNVLEQAKRGIFPLASMQEYTTNYLRAGGKRAFSEYYVAKYEGARFDPTLVENVLFAQHDLAIDRSFAEFNVIFCRNVMIYFDANLKRRVVKLFTDSLVNFGVLALGRKESLGDAPEKGRYEPLVAEERIFRRLP